MAMEAQTGDGPSMTSRMPVEEPSGSVGRRIFLGPRGIRAGWRILIFVAIFAVLGAGTNFTMHRIPAVQAWQKTLPKNGFVPSALLLGEGLSVLMLMIAALVMTKIEKKTFRDYGLPLEEALGKRFWQGAVFGLGMVSLLMAAIASLHGFSISGLALDGAAALRYGVLYAIGFLLVGIFEEFSRCGERGVSGSRLGRTRRLIGGKRICIRWRIAGLRRRDICYGRRFTGRHG